MFKQGIAFTLALCFVLGVQNAQAFFDPPWITPVAPVAGEEVSVNIRGGICDSIFFRPGYPQITQQGNAIRILEYGHHWDSDDLCIYGIGTLTEPVGAFPPGNYTLTVDFLYEDFFFGYTVITLGVVPFTVTGTSAVAPVPTTGPLGLVALLVIISGLAIWPLWIRRHRADGSRQTQDSAP